MKNLYTVRWLDGALLRFDTGSWSQVGTGTISSWPTLSAYKANFGCFAYRGKLHVCHGDGNNIYIVRLDGTSMTDVVQIDTTSPLAYSNAQQVWGNPFQYKGRVHWFVNPIDGNYDERSFLASFWYDGTTPQLSFDIVSSLPASDNTDLDSNYASASTFVPRIQVADDRLMIGPPGGSGYTPYDGGGRPKCVQHAIFDIDDNNVVSASNMPVSFDGQARWLSTNVSGNSYSPPAEDFRNAYASSTTWKGKWYGVDFTGRIVESDLRSGNKTEIFDLTSTLNNSIGNGSIWTSETFQVGVSYGTVYQSTHPDRLWYPYSVGGKLTVYDYNGVSGDNVDGYITHCSDTTIEARRFDNDELMDQQPSGTQFEVRWALGETPILMGNFPTRFTYMFPYDDHLWCLNAVGNQGVSDNQNDVDRVPSWMLFKWDGNIVTQVFNVTPVGHPLRGVGWSPCLDEDSGTLHLFVADNDQNTINHFSIDLTEANPQITSRPSPHTQTGDFGDGLPLGFSVAFDEKDITPTIESVSYDDANGHVTISYTLWCENDSNTADISVEYNIGTGWVEGSRSGVLGEDKTGLSALIAGQAHTFVHDLVGDVGPSVDVDIQYRIKVINQTRV